jgi:hypothetical protein
MPRREQADLLRQARRVHHSEGPVGLAIRPCRGGHLGGLKRVAQFYNAASASTISLELTTVPCRGNTFSMRSLCTSGSLSAHPSSTTTSW